MRSKRWSAEEDAYVIANYSQKTSAQIGKDLNRSRNAVDLHIHYVLRLRKKGYSKTLYCDYCGKQFTRYPSYIAAHSHVWGQFCNRICRGKWISEHIIGELHPNWQGGKKPYNGRWRQVSRLARKRAKGFCETCGKSEGENGRRLDIHHLISIRQFLMPEAAHYIKNVICLCRHCHRMAHIPS